MTLSEVIAINHRSIIEREPLEILTPQGQIEDAIQKLLAEMKFEAKIANQDTGDICLSRRLPGDEWRNQDDSQSEEEKGQPPTPIVVYMGKFARQGLTNLPGLL